MQAYNYGIGYNETLGVYIFKKDMIEYHKYKATVFSDEGSQWHLNMIKKIENIKEL